MVDCLLWNLNVVKSNESLYVLILVEHIYGTQENLGEEAMCGAWRDKGARNV